MSVQFRNYNIIDIQKFNKLFNGEKRMRKKIFKFIFCTAILSAHFAPVTENEMMKLISLPC